MEAQDRTMQGKVCLVTGATSGIGKAAALELARRGATLVLVGRNRLKCERTVEEIQRRTGNDSVEYLLADLSYQRHIRDLVHQFQSRHQQLHVLFNNAGAIVLTRQRSGDHIELTFALNHLGYFMLTCMLLDTMKASAPSRIINVSSDAHQRAILELDDLQCQREYRGFWTYARSKLANILFTYELSRRVEGTGVTVNAYHPGLVATNFLGNNGLLGKFLALFLKVRGRSPELGADTGVFLATSRDVERVSGQYFVDRQPAVSSVMSYDREIAKGLWDASLELTGLEDIPYPGSISPQSLAGDDPAESTEPAEITQTAEGGQSSAD